MLFRSRLTTYVKDTDQNYTENYENGLTTYPIPFFGNIETAKILTVGVNPSNGEFKNRGWPEELSTQSLTERLLNYFSLETTPPHPWFRDWDEAVNVLNCSYQKGEVAHLDLSPRATIPMGQAPNQIKFLEMVKNDIGWFFRLLSLCKNAKLLMMAGSVTNKYYINELIQEHAGEHGFDLLFKFKRGGKGPTFIHKLKGNNINLPVFFCGVSPSARNSQILIQRINERREKLLSYLN